MLLVSPSQSAARGRTLQLKVPSQDHALQAFHAHAAQEWHGVGTALGGRGPPSVKMQSMLRPVAAPRVAAFRAPVRVVRMLQGASAGVLGLSSSRAAHPASIQQLQAPSQTCCNTQAPAATRRVAPVVCAAAAAEPATAEVVGTKEGVAHLRFQRGSPNKVHSSGATQLGELGTFQPNLRAACRWKHQMAPAQLFSGGAGPQQEGAWRVVLEQPMRTAQALACPAQQRHWRRCGTSG